MFLKKILFLLISSVIFTTFTTGCDQVEDNAKKQTKDSQTENSNTKAESEVTNLHECYVSIALKHSDSLAICQKMAEKKNPEAEYMMARIYRDGIGVPQDFNKRIFWTHRAAASGYVAAVTDMGGIGLGMYMHNHVKESGLQSLGFLKAAMDAGSIKARFQLAKVAGTKDFEELGIYNPEFSQKEMIYLADKKYPEAEILASFNYAEGFGCMPNHEKAIKYLEDAAEQGFAYAYEQLSKIYLNNDNFKDLKRGTAYYWNYTRCDDSSDNMRILDQIKKEFKTENELKEVKELSDNLFHECHTVEDYDDEAYNNPLIDESNGKKPLLMKPVTRPEDFNEIETSIQNIEGPSKNTQLEEDKKNNIKNSTSKETKK